MSSRSEDVARIVRVLSAAESPLRHEAAELVVDHALGLSLDAVLDADSLSEVYVAALSEQNVARAIERHVLPGIARVRALLREAGERLGDAVPGEVTARIEALATKRDGPRGTWMRGALDPALLRELLAPALAQTLLEFVRDLPLAGGLAEGGSSGSGRPGLTAGLVGRLGREVQKSTERLVNVGRSVAGGLGVDLDRVVQQRAREFSQGAVASIQRALRERFASPEGAALLAQLSRGVVRHVLATPVEVILQDLDRLPLEDAVRLAPATVAHDLSRELGQRALEGEIRAYLAAEGARSLRELLEEAGLLARVRALAVERVHAGAVGLFASPAFADWLERLLSGE
jgi:hypothetical protein